MKYIVLFIGVGLFFTTLAVSLQGWGWLFLWPAVSFWLVAAAYAGLGYRVFGKQDNGRLAIWALMLMLPYLLVRWGIWHLEHRILKEDCYNEVAPGIFLGRRAFARELPQDINLIVDLTAEFPVLKEVIEGKSYVCLPTLDASVPSEAEFQKLVEQLVDWEGNIYLHCAIGHGRSATVAGALLIARGLADNAREAEEMLKTARPWVNLSQSQKGLLQQFKPVQSVQ
ncbi:dual specificity protein phosphatase family protein [Oxynema aestuarii]|jgi:protein-tyrosine phosphatase|uniref:protein-tyrosine-phosphatase n=1 Tax=Oxynema aestuarii AP17 TaxID=2064643 RepID=A0A6H1TTW1_9CYAN|nr:dual specificity protein phosphatase family protein [Oxynema aestuarii]QIZ69587.1 hypothetical protein HCG48_02455 [Oxynema aestuarii AP17]